jgi:hypothetical protein
VIESEEKAVLLSPVKFSSSTLGQSCSALNKGPLRTVRMHKSEIQALWFSPWITERSVFHFPVGLVYASCSISRHGFSQLQSWQKPDTSTFCASCVTRGGVARRTWRHIDAPSYNSHEFVILCPRCRMTAWFQDGQRLQCLSSLNCFRTPPRSLLLGQLG